MHLPIWSQASGLRHSSGRHHLGERPTGAWLPLTWQGGRILRVDQLLLPQETTGCATETVALGAGTSLSPQAARTPVGCVNSVSCTDPDAGRPILRRDR